MGKLKKISSKISKVFNDWWKVSSDIEKALAIIIGFIVGDFINDIVIHFVDSFLLDTIIGVSSIFVTIAVFQLVRLKEKSAR